MNNQYFVLIDMGYDGILIQLFNTEHDALKYYHEHLEQEKKHIETKDYGQDYEGEPIALIKGELLKSDFGFKEVYLDSEGINQ